MIDKRIKLKVGEKEYSIEIKKKDNESLNISVDGQDFLFQEEKKEKEIHIAKTSLPKRNFVEKQIKAPISGIVSDVFVKEGQFVKKGSKVVLLSAMKMENEIISENEGRIKKVFVKKEQKVKERDTLIILE